MTLVPEHLRITTISITTGDKNAKPKPEEADRRYRTIVSLHRSDRPKYWQFNCVNCKYPVCDMMNTEVVALSDLIDMENIDTLGVGVRCPSSYCHRWYYFNLS